MGLTISINLISYLPIGKRSVFLQIMAIFKIIPEVLSKDLLDNFF